jgi:hypothetical protein
MNTAAPREVNLDHVRALIEHSYARHGRPREEIEAEIMERYKKDDTIKLNPFV